MVSGERGGFEVVSGERSVMVSEAAAFVYWVRAARETVMWTE